MDAAATLPREPRTERGRRTQRAILDAAAAEFGDKGFHESSIVSITQRAGVALGSFYTYFESKEALFKALVLDMSEQVRQLALPIVAEALDPVEPSFRSSPGSSNSRASTAKSTGSSTKPNSSRRMPGGRTIMAVPDVSLPASRLPRIAGRLPARSTKSTPGRSSA